MRDDLLLKHLAAMTDRMVGMGVETSKAREQRNEAVIERAESGVRVERLLDYIEGHVNWAKEKAELNAMAPELKSVYEQIVAGGTKVLKEYRRWS